MQSAFFFILCACLAPACPLPRLPAKAKATYFFLHDVRQFSGGLRCCILIRLIVLQLKQCFLALQLITNSARSHLGLRCRGQPGGRGRDGRAHTDGSLQGCCCRCCCRPSWSHPCCQALLLRSIYAPTCPPSAALNPPARPDNFRGAAGGARGGGALLHLPARHVLLPPPAGARAHGVTALLRSMCSLGCRATRHVVGTTLRLLARAAQQRALMYLPCPLPSYLSRCPLR